MNDIEKLKIKIFADGADKDTILEIHKKPFIKGFTTNPTLMRKAGIDNYESFAKEILNYIKDKPISFEVFSDDVPEMQRQAMKIASWGDNVYVKIPVTNTKGESTAKLIKDLAHAGVKQNVTALMTLDQVKIIRDALSDGPNAVISVFAGRIADTGCDPVPVMAKAVELLVLHSNLELIWASPRELLNIFQANNIGCHIITVTNSILNKLEGVGKNLDNFSLETVKMFYNDAVKAGFEL